MANKFHGHNIIALDIGTKCGIAIYKNGEIEHHTLNFETKYPQNKFVKAARIFGEIAQEIQPTIVFYEQVRRHIGTQAAHVYGGLLAVAMVKFHPAPLHGIGVTEIKKHITGKGNASKAMVIDAVRKMGFHPQDDNAADALAILDFAIRKWSDQ